MPVERFIDGKGGRKSLLKDYQVLAHFLSVRLGTASTCWLCVSEGILKIATVLVCERLLGGQILVP